MSVENSKLHQALLSVLGQLRGSLVCVHEPLKYIRKVLGSLVCVHEPLKYIRKVLLKVIV